MIAPDPTDIQSDWSTFQKSRTSDEHTQSGVALHIEDEIKSILERATGTVYPLIFAQRLLRSAPLDEKRFYDVHKATLPFLPLTEHRPPPTKVRRDLAESINSLIRAHVGSSPSDAPSEIHLLFGPHGSHAEEDAFVNHVRNLIGNRTDSITAVWAESDLIHPYQLDWSLFENLYMALTEQDPLFIPYAGVSWLIELSQPEFSFKAKKFIHDLDHLVLSPHLQEFHSLLDTHVVGHQQANALLKGIAALRAEGLQVHLETERIVGELSESWLRFVGQKDLFERALGSPVSKSSLELVAMMVLKSLSDGSWLRDRATVDALLNPLWFDNGHINIIIRGSYHEKGIHKYLEEAGMKPTSVQWTNDSHGGMRAQRCVEEHFGGPLGPLPANDEVIQIPANVATELRRHILLTVLNPKVNAVEGGLIRLAEKLDEFSSEKIDALWNSLPEHSVVADSFPAAYFAAGFTI